VATLRQVASVGGVPLGALVERLREAAGLPRLAFSDDGGGGPSTRPAWAAESTAARTHDARAAIEAGEHPMPRVMADLAALAEGAVYQLVTPFVPAPLVDLAKGKGFEAFSVASSTQGFGAAIPGVPGGGRGARAPYRVGAGPADLR
jgi:hypothetical protein